MAGGKDLQGLAEEFTMKSGRKILKLLASWN